MNIDPRTNTREVTAINETLGVELAQIASVSGLHAQAKRLATAQRAAERQYEEASRNLARIIKPLPGHQFIINFSAGEDITTGTYRHEDTTKLYQTCLVDRTTEKAGEHGSTFVAEYLEYDDLGQAIAVSPGLATACLVPITETSDGPQVFGVHMVPVPE